MRVELERKITLFYEEIDEDFFGSFRAFAKRVQKNTKKRNKVTQEEHNSAKVDLTKKTVTIEPGRVDLLSKMREAGVIFSKVIDKRINIPMKTKLKHSWGYRDHIQQGFVENFMSSKIKNHYGVMPCGAGKTFSGLKIAEFIGVTTLIIVDETMLSDQWEEDVLKECNFPRERLGIVHGKKKDYKDKDVVIATKQTLSSAKVLRDYLVERTSCLIVDECHTAPTKVYTDVIAHFKPKFRLGLTATPNRQDGQQFLLDNYIGPRHFIATQRELYALGSTLEPTVITYCILEKTPLGLRDWNKKMQNKMHRIFWQGLIKQWKAHLRIHKFIAKLIYEAYLEGRSIAVILKEIEIINMYKKFLLELGVKESELEIMIGETEKDYRKEVIQSMKDFKTKIILTSRLLDKGVSIPRLDTLFNVFPTKDENGTEQRGGRLSRLHPDKHKPIIYDFIYDNYVFYNQFYTKNFNRYNVYEKIAKTEITDRLLTKIWKYFEATDEKQRENERKKLKETKNTHVIFLN